MDNKVEKLMVLNDFFDKIYCVNLDFEKSKWELSLNESIKYKFKLDRFSAIKPSEKDFETRKNIFKKLGAYGCYRSHIEIFNDAIKNKFNSILVFEDDFYFDKYDQNLFEFIKNVPNDWDLMYFGLNFINGEIKIINEFVKKIKNGKLNTTHAYAINRKFMDVVINSKEMIIDRLYTKLVNGNNFYTPNDLYVFQRPGYSVIRDTEADYIKAMKQNWKNANQTK